MNKRDRFIDLVIMSALLFAMSCSVPDDVREKTTMISSYYYEPNYNEIELFFDDIKPDKKFIQLAYIEVLGDRVSSTDVLLNRIKSEAQEVGADAVVNLNKYYITRTQGGFLELIDILSNDDYEPDEYNAPSMKGIAVKYIE